MSWFDRKKPEIKVEPTAEELAARERAALAEKIEATLRSDSRFQVMTVDGLQWICPFTVTRVQAPFGYIEPALEYLLRERPWVGKPTPREHADLQLHRWEIYLREHMEFDTSLRTFASDGRWLNPFNAQWVPLSSRSRQIDAATILEMAQILRDCPEAQSGKLLERYRLQEVVRLESLSHKQKGTAVPEPQRGTTRSSGTRATQTHLKPPTEADAVFDEDLHKAERVLDKILAPLPVIDGFGFTIHYEPHSQVGGDFYECQEIAPGRYLLALGDVSGHGVQGALVLVAALKSLRYVLKQERELIPILTRLNDEVKPDLVQGQFITLFAALLDAPSRTIQCVCAGHHPAVLVSRSRPEVAQRIGLGGGAIGLLSSDMLKRTLRPVTLELKPGDTLLVYTDGLTEVRDFNAVEFGDYRAMASMLANIESPYDEQVRVLVKDARQFASGVMHDDVTVMSLSIDLPAEEGAG